VARGPRDSALGRHGRRRHGEVLVADGGGISRRAYVVTRPAGSRIGRRGRSRRKKIAETHDGDCDPTFQRRGSSGCGTEAASLMMEAAGSQDRVHSNADGRAVRT